MDIENVSMVLIAYSGDARTLAFEALKKARIEDFDEADRLIKEAELASNKAHKAQTELLVNEAQGNKNEINVLLIHAQDHLMTSMLALELISELIYLHKTKENR